MEAKNKTPEERTAEKEGKHQTEPLFQVHPAKQGMRRPKLLN